MASVLHKETYPSTPPSIYSHTNHPPVHPFILPTPYALPVCLYTDLFILLIIPENDRDFLPEKETCLPHS